MWGFLVFLMILACTFCMDSANAVGLVICFGLALVFMTIGMCQKESTPHNRRRTYEGHKKESKENDNFGVIDWDD